MKIRSTSPGLKAMRDTNIFEDEIAFDKKGVATVSDEVGKQLVAKYPALKAVKASKPKEK